MDVCCLEIVSSVIYACKFVVIVEIIDNKRVRFKQYSFHSYPKVDTSPGTNIHGTQVLVEGPSSEDKHSVPRHDAKLSYMSLTGIVIPKLPRGIGRTALKKKWEEHEVESKWAKSNFAQSRARSERRKELSDFERYKVMKLSRQVC